MNAENCYGLWVEGIGIALILVGVVGKLTRPSAKREYRPWEEERVNGAGEEVGREFWG